jgi:hypothetical protein
LGEDSGKGFLKNSEGQSSFDKDIQGAETQFAMSESEGQLLEDIEKVGSMVTSAYFPLLGVPVSMGPSDDDPLASQKAVDQLRRKRSLRPSHVADGGGDASQSYHSERFEFERPYFGPSHVVEGGGDEFKRFYSEHHAVELPTESRKMELRGRISEIERDMKHDSRFHKFLWSMKHRQPGPGRYKAIEKFWQEIYEERQPEDLNLTLKSFSLNDFFIAQDELYTLEHPMRPPPIRSWDHLWSRRSSAGTDGSGSLSFPIVGPESCSTTGLTDTCVASRNPSHPGGAFSLRGGL